MLLSICLAACALICLCMLQFEINLHYRSPFWFRHLRETNFPDGAMKRFLSSAAPSSSGRAEPPSSSSSAEQPATSLRSAEQPATPSHLKILSIRDVQRWLAEEPIASCSSADAQRIREAVAVLSHPKPRQEDVRPLLSKWQVLQQKKRKNRDR